MNAPDVAFQVARQFTALRRKYLVVKTGTVLMAVFGGLMACWLLVAAIDHRWEWNVATRQRILWTVLGVSGALILWRLAVVIRRTRQRAFAGIVERSFSDFGQRIRTVLDTVEGKVDGPPEMLMALGNQTLGRWESVVPSRLVPYRKFAAVSVTALLALILCGVMCSLSGDWPIAMRRALGSSERYTTLEVTPGNIRLLEGTPVEVSLALSGRTDRDVLLRYRELPLPEELQAEPQVVDASESSENGAASDEADQEAGPFWIESELLADESAEEASGTTRSFSTSLGKALRPIEYCFVSAGQTTPVHRIEIQPLIETQRIEIEVKPPEYTGLQPRLFAKPDLTVLEQSEVSVTIQLNHPLGEAVLEVGPKLSKLAPQPLESPEDPARWTFQLPSTGGLRWRFSGSGRDGTPMEPVSGRLGIRRDAPPTVSWREPTDEIKVHTLAEVPLGVQIGDDFGITEAGIAFQLGGDEEYILTDWAKSESEDDDSDVTGEKTRLLLAELLPLESFALTERDYIAYYAYAVDNRPWGNRRSESDIRYIDIRPLRQFYQEVDPPGGNGGGGQRILVQLDEIIRRERFLINRTRKLVREGTSMASQLGTIDRLVKNQSELADLTRFLAEFFISRGNDDVEALSQAEAIMLQAADSLAAGSLDLSLAQEQEAMRALAEARRTLEIALLKRLTAAQRRAMRRFSQQLRQKLRRDRPETEREIADTLQQIAAQQRRVGMQANRLAAADSPSAGSSGNPSGSPSKPGTGGGSEGSPAQGDASTQENVTAAPDPETPIDTDDGGEDAAASEPDPADGPDDEAMVGTGEEQADPGEALFEQQIDLLERLEGIRDSLGERLSKSDLMSQRMDEAQAQMDELATEAREREYSRLSESAGAVSDQIEEMALQLEALSAAEPVTRVSSLRDLTLGIAGMEQSLSDRLSAGRPREAENATARPRTTRGRLAERLEARTETLGDVLRSQAEIGDIEMSEVNDQLQRFAEESSFLDQLEATRSAVGELDGEQEDGKSERSAEAMERALDYASAARELERLYQQLVTPRLARLRRMEQRASSLANRMGGGGGGEKREPENEAELRELEKELREEDLRELAQMLVGGGQEDSEAEEKGKSGDESQQRERSANGMAVLPQETTAGRVRLVADELRKRIQQVMLMEIAADRDTPIPEMYRRAVDGYFKTLASQSPDPSADGNTAMPGDKP